MSKIGKKAIILPKESTVKVDGGKVLDYRTKGSEKIVFNDKIFSSKINDKNELQICL